MGVPIRVQAIDWTRWGRRRFSPPASRDLDPGRQLGHHLIQRPAGDEAEIPDPTCAWLRTSSQQLQIDLLVAKLQRPAPRAG